MAKYELRTCSCGHCAEIIGEAPAAGKFNTDGDCNEMWFTDVVWYRVRCTDCDLETDIHYTFEKACDAWNNEELSKYSYPR